MQNLPRAAAIHDLSGFGKCSLTVALPILSVCGVEVSCLPTAILSTHTGGFTGYTFRDLTEDMTPFYKHWQKENIAFDALYSGYLGNVEQIDIVRNIFSAFRTDKNLILVDPVMADNGKMYSLFGGEMIKGMRRLCACADVVVPNMTEAAFLLDEPYKKGPYLKEDILNTCEKLCALGAKKAVLTGACTTDASVGAAYYDAQTGAFGLCEASHVDGMFHGAGDVFASVLLACLLNEKDLESSTQTAVAFTHECISRSFKRKTDTRCGLDFEHGLWKLGQDLLTDKGEK